ncbi:MAG: polyprenyl synthetase family protein [Thiomargarita sp.]|nr:polyprenyl synthetase family protein [Thiomargarita sp.]
MDFVAIRKLIEHDIQAVNVLIHKSLYSEVALVNTIGDYIVNSGGKRLRPMLLLLSAKVFNYKGTNHIDLAAVIEFIHTATLLHDDVVDDSKLRRGQPTANNIWSNEASILVGDFLYSRSFQMMVNVKNMRVMEILSDATNIIAEGEVLQLLHCHEPDTSEENYLQVIERKTAKLFESAAQLGAVVNNQPSEYEQAMVTYGMNIGTAFQLIDDVLDYTGTVENVGKNIGDDLAEGKPTLPLIYALKQGDSEQKKILYKAIKEGIKDRTIENTRKELEFIQSIILSTNAIEYTKQIAKKKVDNAIEALSILPSSSYIEALHSFATFAINRTY